jgi:DNA ligase-associated metallophosphoesterase
LRISLANVVLDLLPCRAAWWAGERALLVADLHLGKDAHFVSAGRPIPAGDSGPTGRTLGALDDALDATGARRLVVLGDLFHAGGPGYHAAVDALVRWRSRRRALTITLVRGNHDLKSGDPAANLGFECVDEPWPMGGLALRHTESSEDARPKSAKVGIPGPPCVFGHLHPIVRMDGPAASSARARCFWLRRSSLVLPAFGSFTGGKVVAPGRGDRVFVPAPDRVVEMKLVR